MNTFLPEADFTEVACVLDSRRLNKQIIEVKQILGAIATPSGWSAHPIVTMWRNYTPALAFYGLAMCAGYDARFGYQHSLQPFFEHRLLSADIVMPNWLVAPLIESHRAALVYKQPAHYKRFYPSTTAKLDYIWWHPDLGYYKGQLSQPETIRTIKL